MLWAVMNETLLRPCPKCGTSVRLREGEESVRCEACNAVVPRSPAKVSAEAEGQGLTPSVVLIGSLLLMVAGAAAFRTFRKGGTGASSSGPSASQEAPYAPPPLVATAEAPAGELAWEPQARAPIVFLANADGVEDIFGFIRVWDGRSAWTFYAGVFDGATLAPMWRSEPIDPQIVKRDGVLPTALAVGNRVVVSDTTANLRVFDLASGNKLLTLRMADVVVDMCKATEPPSRVWVQVAGDQHALVDVDTGKATFAPHPTWCALPEPQKEAAPAKRRRSDPVAADATPPNRACQDDFRNGTARATCLPGEDVPLVEGAVSHYMLKSGGAAVVLATKDDRPLAIGIGPGRKVGWSTPLVADETKPRPEAPHIAELADGRLYAVYAKIYFDARLVALDAATGSRLWDVPLVGSMASSSLGDLGRGEARGLVASKSRVYVTRSGGGLDVFDATDGKALGTIGKK
jgi:outer membrane protein assembly factor BamB